MDAEFSPGREVDSGSDCVTVPVVAETSVVDRLEEVCTVFVGAFDMYPLFESATGLARDCVVETGILEFGTELPSLSDLGSACNCTPEGDTSGTEDGFESLSEFSEVGERFIG